MTSRFRSGSATRFAALGLVLAVSVATGAAISGATGSSPSATAEPAVPQMKIEGTALADLAPEIAALRRPRTSADDDAVATFKGLAVEQDDVIDASTAIAVPDAPSPALLASGKGGRWLCLMVTGAASCADAATVEKTGFAPSYSWNASGDVTVSGVAVDAVRSITTVDTAGKTTVLPVTDNVVLAHPGSLPREIRWTSPSGKPEVFEVARGSAPPLPRKDA